MFILVARQGNISGWNDTVVATNNRIIVHRIKWRWLGKAVYEEVAWEDVQNATIDGLFGLANLHLTTTDGRKLLVGNLVKTQAQALLAICNERIKQVDAAKRVIAPETQSMYCPNCGAESNESANFCRQCGQALSGADENSRADSKAPAQTATDSQSEAPPKPSEEVTTKQAVGCIVAILVGIAVLVWLISSCQAAGEADIEEVPAEVTVEKLLADYEQSEAKANRLYRGRYIHIRGTAGSLGYVDHGSDYRMIHSTKRRTGPPGVVVISKESISGVQCEFDSKNAASFRALERGSPVVVWGVVDSYARGYVVVKDCQIY